VSCGSWNQVTPGVNAITVLYGRHRVALKPIRNGFETSTSMVAPNLFTKQSLILEKMWSGVLACIFQVLTKLRVQGVAGKCWITGFSLLSNTGCAVPLKNAHAGNWEAIRKSKPQEMVTVHKDRADTRCASVHFDSLKCLQASSGGVCNCTD
jgi:hypothetical protein